MADKEAPSCKAKISKNGTDRVGRREFLEATAGLLVAGGIALGAGQSARAQDKAAKSDVSYQDSPNAGQKCSGCQFFDGNGACQVVEGAISPDGWCTAWSAG